MAGLLVYVIISLWSGVVRFRASCMTWNTLCCVIDDAADGWSWNGRNGWNGRIWSRRPTQLRCMLLDDFSWFVGAMLLIGLFFKILDRIILSLSLALSEHAWEGYSCLSVSLSVCLSVMLWFWRLLTINCWFRYELTQNDDFRTFIVLFFFLFRADFWESKLSTLRSFELL